MGITSFSKELLEEVFKTHEPKTVCELGAQNDYTYPLPAPYASEYYQAKGIDYSCIDMNGENGAAPFDLTKPIKAEKHDLVTDFGTGEHCGRTIEDFYQVMKNIDELCKAGGIIIRENPKTGSWPGHGFHYMTKKFYKDFCKLTGYRLIKCGEHAAMGNEVDGWNVYAVMEKKNKKFPTLEKFKELEVLSA